MNGNADLLRETVGGCDYCANAHPAQSATMTNRQRKKIAVVGGGLCGLAAARRALSLGAEVELFERDARIGGMARSWKIGGQTFDLGPHTLHATHQEFVEDLHSLLGEDLIEVSPSRGIWKDGRLLRHPFHIGNFIRAMPIKSVPVPILSFIAARLLLTSRKPERNLEEWAVNRFGRPFYNFYVRDHVTRNLGVLPAHLPALLGMQRIRIPTLGQAVRQLFQSAEPLRTAYYPRLGIGQLSEKLAAGISTQGARISTQSAVTAWDYDGCTAELLISGRGSGTRRYDAVINTAPVDEFVLAGRESVVPDSVRNAALRIRYRSAIFVFVATGPGSRAMPYAMCYFPSQEYLFARVYEPAHYSISCSDGADSSGLCLEVHCNEGDEVWGLSEADIVARVLNDLRRIPFMRGVANSKVIGIIRLSRHYPLSDPSSGPVRTLDSFFERFPSAIVCAGRQGTHRYTNMDEVIRMGITAAEVIFGVLPPSDVHGMADEPRFVEDGSWRR